MEPTMDALFRWKKQVSVGDRTLWCRTLSSTDDAERVRQAIQFSRRVRSRLVAEGSEERENLILSLEGASRNDLLAVGEAYHTEMARAAVVREVHPDKDPPEPKEQTLEAVHEADEEWARILSELGVRQAMWVKEHVAVAVGKMREMDDEALRTEVTDMEVNALVNQAYMNEFEWQTVYRALYDDEGFKHRSFTLPEVKDMDGRVFRKLLDEYYELDRFVASAEYLKN